MKNTISKTKQLLFSPLAEVIGLILILLSVGWQVFFEESMKDIELRGEFVRLNNKVDTMWDYTGAYAPQLAGESQNRPKRSYNDHTVSFLSYEKNHKHIQSVISFAEIVRVFIFVFGSILTITSRYSQVT